MKDDPELYDYNPYVGRPKIVWPNGARLALWVVPNIEFFEFIPPHNSYRAAYGRQLPDVFKYSLVDYGNRCGVWRLIDIFDKNGIRASVSLNAALCDHHPHIIEAGLRRNWEFFSHGIYNSRFPCGMSEPQEREMIEDAITTIKRHTGHRPAGWLSPGMANTPRTIELLAEYGLSYTAELFHDDQPQPVKVKTGKLISVPYSLATNDLIVSSFSTFGTPRQFGETIKAQFDQLYIEGAESGTVMCIALHPFAIGQPHRVTAFAEALAYIVSHDNVWLTTGREIADWYYQHYYDAAIAKTQTGG